MELADSRSVPVPCVSSSSFPVWQDYWISIPLAIIITLVRFYVSDPIATAIAVRRLHLTPTSLRQRNKQETDPKKKIPSWVLTEIDGFAQDMMLVRTRITRADRTHDL